MLPIRPAVACFPLGMIHVTASALAALTLFEIARSLRRHAKGDWGDLCKDQRNWNDRALKRGWRISSAYHSRSGKEFFVITEADRSETTIQLPHESEPAAKPASRDAPQRKAPSRFKRESVTPEATCANRRTAIESDVVQLELFKCYSSPSPKGRRKSEPQEWKMVSLRECPAPESMIMIDEPGKAAVYWRQHIATTAHFNAEVETVVVLMLNTKLRVKGHYLVSTGTLNEALVRPREVFRLAILAAANAIVLMHNHPSGETDPSSADRDVTRRIREAGHLLQIELCDHVIVGHQRHFSFRESGLL